MTTTEFHGAISQAASTLDAMASLWERHGALPSSCATWRNLAERLRQGLEEKLESIVTPAEVAAVHRIVDLALERSPQCPQCGELMTPMAKINGAPTTDPYIWVEAQEALDAMPTRHQCVPCIRARDRGTP